MKPDDPIQGPHEWGDDDSYREWAETIEVQQQEQQDESWRNVPEQQRLA